MKKIIFFISFCLFTLHAADQACDEQLIVSAPHHVDLWIIDVVEEYDLFDKKFHPDIKNHYRNFVFAQTPTFREIASTVSKYIGLDGELILYHQKRKICVTNSSVLYNKQANFELEFITDKAAELREKNKSSFTNTRRN